MLFLPPVVSQSCAQFCLVVVAADTAVTVVVAHCYCFVAGELELRALSSPHPSLQSDAACQRLAGAARCDIKDSALIPGFYAENRFGLAVRR